MYNRASIRLKAVFSSEKNGDQKAMCLRKSVRSLTTEVIEQRFQWQHNTRNTFLQRQFRKVNTQPFLENSVHKWITAVLNN